MFSLEFAPAAGAVCCGVFCAAGAFGRTLLVILSMGACCCVPVFTSAPMHRVAVPQGNSLPAALQHMCGTYCLVTASASALTVRMHIGLKWDLLPGTATAGFTRWAAGAHCTASCWLPRMCGHYSICISLGRRCAWSVCRRSSMPN